MNSQLCSIIVIVIVCSCSVFGARNITIPETDIEFYYNIWWDVTPPTIQFKLTVESTGWIGLGVSHTPSMGNSDLVIAGFGNRPIDPEDTTFYYNDYHGVNNGTPPIVDDENNWVVSRTDSYENETHTVLSIFRFLDTGDNSGQDIEIKNEPIELMWAVGEFDLFLYHMRRGWVSLNLFDEE